MAMTSKERLIRWKRRTAQRALVGSADNVRYQSDERSVRLARLGAYLTNGRDKRVTEERLSAVLAARRRRKGQSPGGALGGHFGAAIWPEAVALYQNSRAGRGLNESKDKPKTGENPTRAHPPQRACGEQPPEAALSEPLAARRRRKGLEG